MSNYYEDILWAYRNLGRVVTLEEAGSHARLDVHEWLSNPANKRDAFKTLIPAAQKWETEKISSEKRSIVVEEETKSIAELQGILSKAIAAAAEGVDPNSFETLLG